MSQNEDRKVPISQESTSKVQVSTESTSKTQVSQESTTKAQVSKESESNPHFNTKPVCRELPIKMPVNQSSDIKLQAGSEQSSGPISMQQHEDIRRGSLLEKAPYVNFGVDLEHWECPEKIKAPVKNR